MKMGKADQGTQGFGSFVVHHLFGRTTTADPTVPLHYPLLAVLAIVGSIAATTWILPRTQGYFISLAALGTIILYGVLFTSMRLTTDPVFLVLFGGYWLGLVAHYYHAPHVELLQYILITPVAVFATVVLLPQLIVGRRETFTMAVTAVAVGTAVIGVLMLWHELQTEATLYGWVGEEVMGLYGIRTNSVFHKPNTYGFFMMVGTLSALYTYLSRRGLLWLSALGICLVGLVMSEGDAALVGFVVGVVVMLSGVDQWLGLVGVGVTILGVYMAIRVGHIPDVMESTLMYRLHFWVASLDRLAQDPLFGIGFVDPRPEIGEEFGPHNSYVHVLLNTGLIAGALYIGALVYALGRGIRKRWTLWNAFVIGLAAGVFLFMMFESLFLGGLSVSSVVLGITVGLLLLSERDAGSESATALDALKQSRTGRAIKWTRAPSKAADSALRSRES